jgi:putative membrane protein
MRFPLPATITRRAGLTLALLLAVPALLPAQALTDANIVAIFDAANTADIETGGLGASYSRNAEVHELGKSFVDAHTAVRQQGRDLARKLGVTPVLPAGDQGAAAHAATLTRLKGLSGTEFDKAFLDHEIAYHQAVIDAVTKTLLPAIRNPELKALVEKVAPAFVAHMEMAKQLRAKLR